MAQPTALYDTYTAIGDKEDVSELIYNISPTETPGLSACGVAEAGQKFTQWQTDVLDSPDGTNAAVEGDDPDLVEPDPTTLVGNYQQISTKVFGVSGTLEVTSKYGRDSEIAYQAAKKARSLKTDVDMAITGVNVASAVGSSAVARRSASLEAWLTSNTSFGATGADGGWNGAGLVLARTDGTPRAFTQGLLDTVIQSAWGNGGKPTMILAGPFQKTAISTFDGLGNAVAASTARTDRASRTVYATVDTYYSNFGILNVVPSRHIRVQAGGGGTGGTTAGIDRNVFCIDPEYLKVAYLRPWQQFDLAKSGDSIKRQMLVEWTLMVCNEAAHALIADVGD